MNKNKKIFITISIVLTIITLLVGVTYATLTYTKISENQELIVGDIWMKYEESNQLVLEDAMPIDINKYKTLGYQANPIMATQKTFDNELTSCVWGSGFDGVSNAESYCKGTGTIDGGITIQEEIDNWSTDEYFLEEGGQLLLDLGIIIQDGDTYRVNPVMETQEVNKLDLCVIFYTSWGYNFDEGSTVESFCKGTGTANGYTIQEDLDEWIEADEYFLENGGQELLDTGIIIQEEDTYRVNPIMSTQEINELTSCFDFYFSRWGYDFDEGSSAVSFCKGTGTANGYTIQEYLDEWIEADEYFLENGGQELLDAGIIIEKVNIDLPYFEFKISGKNTYDKNDVWYEIVLNHGDDHETRTTRIRDDLLRFSLVEIKDRVETFVINDQKYNDLTNKRIFVNTIDKNTNEEIEITYRLYMWIDESTVIGNYDEDYTLEEWEDVFASIKVNVNGDFNEKELVLEYEDIYDVTEPSCFTTYETAFYTRNENMTEDELNLCIEYVLDYRGQDFEKTKAYCDGTGAIRGYTFQYELNVLNFTSEQLLAFENANIVSKEIGLGIEGYDTTCGSDIVIPKTINNSKILRIGSSAFWYKNLTSVILPNELKAIESNAFVYNSITNLTIPSSVTYIGGDAFWDNKITNLNLENGVKDIAGGSFQNNFLTNVLLPSSIESYSCDAFDSNVSIESVTNLECVSSCLYNGCPE